MTKREPLYTERDRAELLALGEYRASLCPCGCGHPVAETTAHWTVGPEYDATKVTCRARAELNEAKRGAVERDKSDADAWLWSIQSQKRR